MGRSVRSCSASWGWPVALVAVLAVVLAPLPAVGSAAGAAALAQQGLSGVSPPAPQRVGASSDPVVAAVQISQATFPAGAARHVLVGRDDVFADSLAGSVLAGKAGPLLYTTGGAGRAPRPEMLAEVARVLGAGQGCGGEQRVYLLGGTQAVSVEVERAIAAAGYCVHRFAGASRVETSVEIARWVTRSGPPARALLARADLWADAATGGAYAAASGSPILVTQRDSLHPAVADLLRTWGRPAVLLGGTAALSQGVEGAVGAIVGTGYGGVERAAGAARDGTAAEIGARLWTWPHSPLAVVLVNGYRDDAWTWALAVAPFAARKRAVELYVQRDGLPPGTARYLKEWFWGPVIAVGPEDAVSPRAVAAAYERRFEGGDLAGRYKWLNTYQGKPLRWNPCEEIRYVVNPRHGPADAVDRVHEAFKRIAEVSGLRFTFTGTVSDRGFAAGGTHRMLPDPRYAPKYSPVLVWFATPAEVPSLEGLGGRAYPIMAWSSSDQPVYASGEVVINASAIDPSQREPHLARQFLRSALVHEIGHVLGLDHPDLWPSMMSSYAGDDLGAGDRFGFYTLGAGSGCLVTPRHG